MQHQLKFVSRKCFQNQLVPSSALFDELMRRPSSIPPSKGGPSSFGLSAQRQLTLHPFLISIYNRNVISMFTPLKFKTTKTLDLHLHRNT